MSSETDAPETGDAVEPAGADIPRWSARGLCGLWLLVTAPMAGLSLGLAPWLIAWMPGAEPGLVYWAAIIAGMAWQTAVSVGVLVREGQDWRWPALRRSLWLAAPRLPGADRPAWSALLLVTPIGIAVVFGVDLVFGRLDAWLAARLPGRLAPPYGDIALLARPENTGAWGLLWMALLSSLFNYVLGEAFFFHGILLPRMVGRFGRWAWAANAAAFGLYHVHKATAWPTVLLSCVAYSWPSQRLRSVWPALLIHGFEGLVLIAAVLFVVLGGLA